MSLPKDKLELLKSLASLDIRGGGGANKFSAALTFISSSGNKDMEVFASNVEKLLAHGKKTAAAKFYTGIALDMATEEKEKTGKNNKQKKTKDKDKPETTTQTSKPKTTSTHTIKQLPTTSKPASLPPSFPSPLTSPKSSSWDSVPPSILSQNKNRSSILASFSSSSLPYPTPFTVPPDQAKLVFAALKMNTHVAGRSGKFKDALKKAAEGNEGLVKAVEKAMGVYKSNKSR